MKKQDCAGCLLFKKQLQIQKADYEFQLKKIQQDKSTQKAMYEIHLQKEVRRWQDNFHKEQSHREEETHNWLTKYDKTISQFQNKIENLNQQHDMTLRTSIQQITINNQTKYSNTVSQYEQTIKQMKLSQENETNGLKESHAEKIRSINDANDTFVSDLKRVHKSSMDEKTKSYESRILGAQSQKNKQCQLHKKSKKDAQDMQTRLYQQIFGHKKTIIELENKIETQQKEIMNKKATIEGLEGKVDSLIEENKNKIAQLSEENEKNLETNRENFKCKIKSVYEDALRYCNKYQESISRIEQTRNNQKEQYLSNLEQIEQSVENRMSRPEDLEEIENLRLAFLKKSKQCELMNEELKWFRLELENKEETYNKIFVPFNSTNNNHENVIGKRKEFKLRRQGRSVTTVREILQSIGSGNLEKKATPIIPRPKLL